MVLRGKGMAGGGGSKRHIGDAGFGGKKWSNVDEHDVRDKQGGSAPSQLVATVWGMSIGADRASREACQAR